MPSKALLSALSGATKMSSEGYEMLLREGKSPQVVSGSFMALYNADCRLEAARYLAICYVELKHAVILLETAFRNKDMAMLQTLHVSGAIDGLVLEDVRKLEQRLPGSCETRYTEARARSRRPK